MDRMGCVLRSLDQAGYTPLEGSRSRGTKVVDTVKGKVFVKFGTGGTRASKELLEYEALGLKHLSSCAPPELIVPRAVLVDQVPATNEAYICLEYMDMRGDGRGDCMKTLGKSLAQMHATKPTLYSSFGFPVDGCCGSLFQPNNVTGRDLNWVEFYREFRLGYQLKTANERYVDRELEEKGAQLMKRLPDLFSALVVEDIEPSILHGDLWAGNYGFVDGSPVIFDPACYYGHTEADLGIAYMFGGFSASFFDAYHRVLPKAEGFSRRAMLYELYHHLNHLNIFGTGYRQGCIRLMDTILGSPTA
mmetsp:Transcript_17814/g.28839  ORF Transcript_17814/g.28839 Transcript_17814/m.28839 type:complete len:304 (-) Transcript_17814:1530-2441(-)|eukprot:CAMPEP_0203776876 /NCGR_PEP_ID=MMETSP0099_2-20121227/7032_1 /ASSEMBLY_ACC=CAM_ASM_000209 /TAXON_ID=96639 /ORGANISM=" , Strain NY0313808BC1" /LENGTH=303 /DNA_ID=CAMNT_0050676017 /DNA_START=158 /DNA_END=1069 /DNA_ORIENTATION=-